MKRLFVFSIGTALCAFLLNGCAVPLVAAYMAPGILAAKKTQDNMANSSNRDGAMVTRDLKEPMTGEMFVTNVRKAAAAEKYEIMSVNQMGLGGTMVILNKHGSVSMFSFGKMPPRVTLTVQLLSGGKQVSVSANVSGTQEELHPDADINAFLKGFDDGSTVVAAAK